MFSNKFICRLIVPLIFEQLLAVSVGMVDTFMVSIVGQVAVSGVALVDNINRLIIQIMAAFATGGVVIASQYFGCDDRVRARHTCAQLETIMMIFSVVAALIFCVFTSPILSLIFGSIEKDVMDCATTYLFITALSYPFLGMYNAGAAIFRSVGNSKISMNISLLMNAINIVLNAVFVFGAGIGVAGVALATLISRVVAGVVMTIFALSKKNPMAVHNLKKYIPKKAFVVRILKIGIPSGIENGMFQIGKIVVVSMVATLGTDAIAANSIAFQVIDFPNIPGTAIGLSMVTIVGQCLGAGSAEDAKVYTKKLMKLTYLSDWVCKLLLLVTAPYIVSLFSLSPSATETAVFVLRCFSIASLPVWPLSFALPNSLRAAGDVNYSLGVSMISMWVFRIICSYVMVMVLGWGVLGVWLGMFIDWYARGVAYLARYLSGKWKKHRVI